MSLPAAPVPGPADEIFTIGREGDLALDDNRFLHRHFRQVTQQEGHWRPVNIRSRLSATITHAARSVQAGLGPGFRLPTVSRASTVTSTAGPTIDEFTVHTDAPQSTAPVPGSTCGRSTTERAIAVMPTQKLLILALAEPLPSREGRLTGRGATERLRQQRMRGSRDE